MDSKLSSDIKTQNKEEWSFQQGDILGILNYLHNGYNTGDLNRISLKREHKYPRFKVEDYIQDVDFKGLD